MLQAAGLSLADVVKVNVYLIDMADFAAMNTVYATVFEQPYPARTTVAVAGLPAGRADRDRDDRGQIIAAGAKKGKKGK